MSIAFVDLQAQRARIADRIDRAMAKVLEHGRFIMGPEVAELEAELAAFCGARHCVSCASGTDALAMVLLGWGIKPGDAVFVPSFTFVATAEVVALVGATPVFVDVYPDTFNMDVRSLERAVAHARAHGLTPRAVIPVGLFGQPADFEPLSELAQAHELRILDDAAQSFGATYSGRAVGTLGHATATSFFPAKPLGCYGDGGAIFTDDDELAHALRSVRVHGQGTDKYDNVRIGLNGRLDTLQAAVLLEKLAIFTDEIAARQRVAERYQAGLGGRVQVPMTLAHATSTWAQYTIQVEDREAVQAACRADDIPTAIYYPMPLTEQTGYRHYPCAPGGAPVSEGLSARVLSLPMHPYLDETTQDRIITAVLAGVGQNA